MAVSKDTFRILIKEGQEAIRDVQLYNRPFDFEENGRYVLVGVRQAGKSYMMYRRANELLRKGHAIEEFVYIDFDDERLLGMTADEFDIILQAYNSVYDRRPILFFDEIQNIAGWEHFARRLANQKYQVFITGSNAKMLSKDIHTTLGSRYFEAKIYPYSFKEFLEAQGIKLNREWEYGKSGLQIQQEFTKYLSWGGFPELILYDNKRRWLNQLYEKIVLGDIILRNKVKNELGLRLNYKRLAECVTKPVSYNRLASMVNAAGVKTTPSSVIDYIRFGKEACLLFSIDNFASKFAEKESIKKYYFVDNGFLNIFLTGGDSMLLENLCAIHMIRNYEEVYFYNKNIEVDFYVPDKAYAVQACWTLADSDTREREIKGLKKLDDLNGLDKMEIITYDEEETIHLPNGKTIHVIPAWKWLLLQTSAGWSSSSGRNAGGGGK